MATTTMTQADLLSAFVEADVDLTAPAPMLASAMTKRLEGADFDAVYGRDFLLDVKLDGWRLTVVKRGTAVCGWTRPRKGKAAAFGVPSNIVTAMQALPDGIYDGEFMAVKAGAKSGDAARVDLPKQFVVFDVLELLGRSLMAETIEDRRAALELAVAHDTTGTVIPVPQVAASWSAVEAIWSVGGEGAILKRRGSRYLPGKRSADWIKVKKLEQHTVTITGFTAGKFGPHTCIEFVFADGQTGRCLAKDGRWRDEFAGAPEAFIGRRLVIECHERFDGGTGSAREPRAKRLLADHLAGDAE